MKSSRAWLARSVAGAAVAVCTLLASFSVQAAPVPGGTLDPLTIPKYVQPLVIPPVMPKSTVSPAPQAQYDIAVRQFKQQILPGGAWNVINGRTDAFPPTTIWSYGRAEDVIPANFVAPVPLDPASPLPLVGKGISFNYPAFTVENTSQTPTSVRWINDLVDPATGNFLPHMFPVDQTLHWANPPKANCVSVPGMMAINPNSTDCHTEIAAPYTGPVPLVTHVHGAHVQPDSDGYPEAWWLPGAPGTKGIPLTYAQHGNVYTQANNTNAVPGSAFYSYENTQPAATLWYHDHALGMTRLNVYAGPAGFWLIRGGAYDAAANVLPGPAPSGAGDPNFNAAYRSTIREIPIAIQDRSFDWADAAGNILTPATPGTVPAGAAQAKLFYPLDRTFFDGFTGPYIGNAGYTGPFAPGPPPVGPSDMSGIWNPEAFFNTVVVNGTTWPKLDVDPVRYRFRLLDGCNSRTLNLSMFEVTGAGLDGIMGTADDTLGPEVPFYQIGAEQGFLPKVAKIMKGYAAVLPGGGAAEVPVVPAPPAQQGLLIGPAERADVIVDFTGMATKRIRIFNTGPDSPFQGFAALVPADPDTTGQVMDFIVTNNTAATDPSTPPANLVLPAEPLLATATTATRQVSLNEMMSDQVCVEINPVTGAMTTLTSVPPNTPNFAATCLATPPSVLGNIVDLAGPRQALLGVLTAGAGGSLVAVPKMWSDPITETPLLNSTEVWEIFNTTADAHPIHLHLVRFEVVERQNIDPITLLPVAGTVTTPRPNETGYKDTVLAYPGQVTRIKARFDIAGLYVWHCHIVEHEDNEMMRPYTVITPAVTGVTSTVAAGTYSTGAVIPITVNFNQPISSTGLTITLNNGATIVTGALTNVATFNGTYTVAAGQNSAVLNVTSITGTITDAVGNVTTNPTVPAMGNLSNAAAIKIYTPFVHPDYTKPILDPATQPHWANGIPNALASYFTFTPFATDAAAVAAGFPAGVCGPGPTQEDCYAVSARQFQQNLGLIQEGTGIPGIPAVPLLTTVWGYGSATNAPAVGPFTAGVWHFPAPTFQNRSNRPARITWANELPNVAPAGFDPSYDCGPNAPNCYPYNRIVTHVHGAHVGDDSDGITTGWYTPLDPATGLPTAVGPDYEPSKYGPPGTFRYENTQEAATVWYHDHAMGTTHTNTNQGMAGFFPITDTYEDALRGITNPASKVLPTGDYEVGFALQDRTFWPDGSLAMPDTPIYNMLADSVNCSINPATNVINPACPAVAFSKDALGALISYNPAIIDPLLRGPFTASGKAFTPCTIDPILGVIPNTCPEVPFSKAPAPASYIIPYNNAIVDPALRGPFTVPSGTLEYFGNVPVVNGVAFGTYNVEPRVYRMRLLGGSDSRTFIMQLQIRGTGNPTAVPPIPDTVIPFWQIGSEQGFLNNPVLRSMITLMPGERIDVLVDFSALTVPNTKVVMANLGPDMPYGGVYVPANRSVDIPEIMEFISLGTSGLSAVPEVTLKPTVPAAPLNIDGYADTAITLRPAGTQIAPTNLTPTVGTPVRNVSLIEITDQYGRTMPTIDSRGFMPAMVPITEVIKLGDTEQWDIINTTVDSHPMHLHQTAFQLIDRLDLPAADPITGLIPGFVPPVTDTMTGTFSQPTYTTTGVTTPPASWEQGWKDTIECPPGKVTRVKAKFDIPGFYVWHCHILSHEEHDMMRPMVVVTPLTPASTVTLTSSAPGNTQPSTPATPVTFTATAMTGIAAHQGPMSFEYQFTVTPPAGVTVTQPTLPPTRMTMIAGSTPGYSMIRQAAWTPPTIPGTYIVTVKAKAIGAADIPANIGTGTLTYTVAAPAVAGVTTTAAAGAYAAGTVIPITVNFNQPISTTGLTLTLNNGAVINTGALTNAATFTGSYTVAAGQNTPVGQSLSIAATTGTITDAAGNITANPAIPAGANIANAKVTTLDPTVPLIAVATPALVNTAATTITGTATPAAANTVTTVTVAVNTGAPVAATVGAGGTFSAPVTLVAGNNAVTITTTDSALKQSVVVQNITFDATATMIAVTTPALVNTATATITGTATPPAANTVTTVTVAVNNGAPGIATVGAGGTFSAPVTLAAGNNTITITTTDSALKQSVVVQNITFDPAATIIAVTTPPLVNTVATTVTGTATPPAAGTVTTVTVTVNNGAPVTATVGAGGTFSAPVTLAAGNNTITVIATDNAVPPRVSTTTSTITLNTAATVIAVTTPPLVNTAGTTITGTATPAAGNTVTTVTVSVNNGAPVTATIGAGGTFSAPVTLAAGSNTITIITTDSALKQSLVVQNITFDPTATVIAVATPPLINSVATPVTGTVTAGANGIGSVTVNGTPVTLGPAGDFSIPVTLKPGSNVITIVVTDTTGKLTRQEYTIVLDDILPPVSTATPASGTYNGAISVVLASETGASIYYTTNGATPTVTTAQLYTGPITIPATTTLQFFAVDLVGNQETVQSRSYTIAGADLSGSVRINSGALYTNSASVNLNLAAADPFGVGQYMVSNDGISYQTVAINPSTSNFAATIPWQLTPGDGLKTVYVKYVDTPTPNNVYGPFTAQITLDTVAPAAIATPAAGTYNGAINVVLTSEAGASIYYTTNGAAPTVSPAQLYNGPITIAATSTVKYFAVDQAGNQEAVQTQSYTIASTDLAGNVAINSGAIYTANAGVTLTLSASDPFGIKQYMISNDGVSYQTFDTPSPSSTTFSATVPWTLTPGDGLKTVYVKYVDTPTPNNVYGPFTAQITLDTTPPVTTAAPASGSYNGAINVVLASETGASIYYTTNGTIPAVATAQLYTGPMAISATTTLQFFAIDPAGNQEAVKSRSYTIAGIDLTGSIRINSGALYTSSTSVNLNLNAADPLGVKQYMLSNDGIAYQTVAITPATSNFVATIPWQLTPGDGLKTVYVKYVDTPTPSNVYGPFTAQITLSTTLPATTATPAGGTYNGAINVVLASGAGASIYYTTDGTTPTAGPAQLYNGPITIAATSTLKYFAVDQAGNQETVQTQVYTIAGSDLTGSVAINLGDRFTHEATVLVALSASDPFGVKQYMISNDGVTYQTFNTPNPSSTAFSATVPWTLTPGDGLKTVYVKYVDTPTPNNIYGPFTAQITLDTAVPVTTATPAGGTYNGAISVVLASESGAKIYYTTNGTTPVVDPALRYSTPFSISASATVKFFAVDQAGNQEAVQSRTYTIADLDLTGSVTINSGALYTTNASVTLTLSASDPFGVKQYMISNDGVSYLTFNTPNPSSTTFSTTVNWPLPPGDGLKTVYVKYVDTPTPNNVYGPFTAQITLDNTPPVTTVTPGSGTYNGAINVVLSTEQNANIYYTTTGAAPTVNPALLYGGPIAIPATSTLRFFAVDQAGNQEAVQTKVYTIADSDLTGSVRINNAAHYTNNASVTLTLSASDPFGVKQYMISNDGLSYQSFNTPNPSSTTFSATVPWTLTAGEGQKTVFVKYVDTPTPNNVYGPFTAQITLDTTPPATAATPASGIYNGAIDVVLASETGASIYYTTNGNIPIVDAALLYSGPFSIGASTTVKFFAVDQAGNQEAVQSHTYTIAGLDLTGNVAINNGALFTTGADVTLTLSASDPQGVGKYMISDDDITYQTFTIATPSANFSASVPWTLASGNGQKTVYVKYVDTPTPNNVYGPFVAQITVDNGAPLISVTSPPNGATVNTPTIQLNGTVIDAGGIQSFTVNGAAVQVVSGAFSTTVTLATGSNTITLIAKDQAGNTEQVVHTVILDTVVPVVSVSPASGSYSSAITVTLNTSKPSAVIHYTTDGTTPTTSSQIYTGPFVLNAATTTTFNVQYFAVDPAGNRTAVQSIAYTIHVTDLANASVTINNGAQFAKSANVTLALAATDPLGVPRMQVACDGITFGAAEAFAATRACTLSAGDGLKTVAVKYIDGAGTIYDPVIAQITLDTVVPVTSATPAAGTYGGSVSVALSASEQAKIYYTVDGSTPTAASAQYTAPILLSSATTTPIALKFFAIDQAGNTESVRTLVYTLHTSDLSQAAVSINNGAGYTNTQTVTLRLAASDSQGVPTMQVACDGVNFGAPEPFAATRTCILPAGDGLKTVAVKFIDGLGIVYDPIPAQITLDTAVPVVSPAPVAGTYENSLAIQLSVNETAEIFFSTDGSVPAQSAVNLYTGPIVLTPSAITTYTVRYFAVDQAGNSSPVQTATYIVHISDLVGSIKINGGVPITTSSDVTLTLSAVDPADVTEMQFSNDGVNYSVLEAYATSKAWLLNPGDGLKTVYVRFKDGAGFLYTFTANIIVSAASTTPPIGDVNGDNVVNIKDALKALQINIGLFTATTDEMVRGDVAPLVNGVPKPDGVISIADALLILRRSVGLVTW